MDDLATLRRVHKPRNGTSSGWSGVWHPERLVADAPPGRPSRPHGRCATPPARPVHTVQHHHAHVAAVMAEHGLDGRDPVIGFAFDGTGYGHRRRRLGRRGAGGRLQGLPACRALDYVPLPGGDRPFTDPYRMALAQLWNAGIAWDDDLSPVAACPAAERSGAGAPAGERLRDHAPHRAWAGSSTRWRRWPACATSSTTRPQAAIELEGLARGAGARPPAVRLRPEAGEGPSVARRPAPVLRAVSTTVGTGVPREVAARFHAGVADLVTDLAVRTRAETGLTTVVSAVGSSSTRCCSRRRGSGSSTRVSPC